MAKGYFTSKISENLEETPEGFLIARDCVIARTGWQTYLVSDLPQKQAGDLGIDLSNQGANIDLYRTPEEVFHPDVLRSFEGKPLTDNHPPDFVDPDNFTEYARGHIQNVRKGKEPLESGEWPMIADVHVEAEPLLTKVRNKIARELSCGYDYGISRQGDKILQTDITGNHVAVVPKGRAGSEARINDAALADAVPSATSTSTAVITVAKEKKPVANRLMHMLGLGLKEYAKDAEPEELAQAAKEVGEHNEKADDKKRARDKKKADDEEEDPEEEAVEMTDKRRAKDRKADDKTKRMHDALDKMMADRKGKAKDTDLEELKDLLDSYFTEEEEEPEHAEDECMDDESEEEEEELEEADDEDVEEDDDIEETEPDGKEEVMSQDKRGRAHDAALDVLRKLRPVVARSKDSAVQSAFNAALRGTARSSHTSTGSYGSFANTSRARGRAADSDSNTGDAGNAKLQAAYNEAFKGGK